MNRSSWKNRLTLSLGIGIASVALIAGCSDDEADDDDLGINTTSTAVATGTMTDATTVVPGATTATPEGTTSAGPAEGTPSELEVSITADGLTADGTNAGVLALAAGSTVTFTNDTDATVALTTDDGAIDEEIEAGDSFEFTFEEEGTWNISVDGEEMSVVTVS